MIAPIRVPGIPLRVRSTWLFAGILLLVALPARAGEVSIALIEVDGAAVEGSTGRIRLTPLGRFRSEDLSTSRKLRLGDLLQCDDTGVKLALSAGEDPLAVMIPGPFKLAVDPTQGRLHISLLSGSVFVETGHPTEVDAGESRTASGHTSYSVTIGRGSRGITLDTVLFEGRVTYAYGGRPESVGQGKWCSVRPGGRPVVQPLTERKADSTARTQAAFQVGYAISMGTVVPDREDAIRQLQSKYIRVLMRPDDADARMELIEKKLDLNVLPATSYHLERIPNDIELHPDLWAKRTLLARALGDTRVSDRQVRRAYQRLSQTDRRKLSEKAWAKSLPIRTSEEGPMEAPVAPPGGLYRGPARPAPNVELAVELVRKKDYEKALEVLKELGAETSEDPIVLLTLAEALRGLEKRREAARYAKAALRTGKDRLSDAQRKSAEMISGGR